MGSALKTAISITGATSTLSKLDKAYHVRDRVTGVPLLGSLVQEDGEQDQDQDEDEEDDDVCLPSHVIPSSAEDSYSQRRRKVGSSGSPSPNRIHRRHPLRQQSRGSSSGRRMSSAVNAKDSNRVDSGSSCSSSSGSDSDSCTSGSESDNESDTSNAPGIPDINITHPSPIATSQSMHSAAPTAQPTTATGLVGGLLRRAASVANLGRVTSLATSQSDTPDNNNKNNTNKTLRPAASQPHLRNAAAAGASAVARSVISTSSGSSNGSSSDQTQRPTSKTGGAGSSAHGSPQTSPDVHQVRRCRTTTMHMRMHMWQGHRTSCTSNPCPTCRCMRRRRHPGLVWMSWAPRLEGLARQAPVKSVGGYVLGKV
ncbi:hypothetical protein BCR44DRAFT_1433975 [Catenaria anguillulae PL171]|uniref:Uncharacterized protein n=1 Tax=Catenaria anguillulae PL171 TaxID=765915 RepID=A0A1Y2HM96_9FUNG|nr:hypothetical protein BCR44DRAFT_1433975 [Catenaria anguillulae PL171]